MNPKKPIPQPPGPKPELLKVNIKKSLEKKKPPEGWPLHKVLRGCGIAIPPMNDARVPVEKLSCETRYR